MRSTKYCLVLCHLIDIAPSFVLIIIIWKSGKQSAFMHPVYQVEKLSIVMISTNEAVTTSSTHAIFFITVDAGLASAQHN